MADAVKWFAGLATLLVGAIPAVFGGELVGGIKQVALVSAVCLVSSAIAAGFVLVTLAEAADMYEDPETPVNEDRLGRSIRLWRFVQGTAFSAGFVMYAIAVLRVAFRA